MPTNPYAEDELKRRAQVGMLGEPTSNTMPVREPPRTIAPIAGRAPAGWDQVNWDDPNMHSVKYDTERLLFGKNRPSEVGEAVRGADFQRRFPGATFNGKDWIDFQGILSDGEKGSPVHGIDFLRGANQETDTSEGHWWGAPEGQAPAQTAQGGPAVDPRMDNSALARIMAELNAASKDEESPAEREAMLAMLGI